MIATLALTIVAAITSLSDGGVSLEAARSVKGTASHYGAACIEGCLALPEHRWGRPGIRVQVCGPAGCITRTSTDAGPSLEMQRAGRVVDLARNDFERVCGCPWSVGLVAVTVRYGGAVDGAVPTPPATDS
jgi:hypothetical protein